MQSRTTGSGGAPGLQEAQRMKIGEEAAKGRVAPILDSMGDVLPLQAKEIATKAINLEGTKVPQRKGVGRERQLIADAIVAKRSLGTPDRMADAL